MTVVEPAAPTVAREQRTTFLGTIGFDWPALGDAPTVAVVDDAARDAAGARLDEAVEVVCLERRPVADDIESLGATIDRSGATRVVGVGNGALLDLVKLAAQRAEAEGETQLELGFVPFGPEPYRAVARFAVVDDGSGGRPTVVEERFVRSNVFVIGELLEQLPPRVAAVHALDTAVHACDSLFSKLANPVSTAHAASALATVVADGGAVDAAARVRLVTASFMAAEAFGSTRLGLAHAIASPLGTSTAMTHDTINGILGRPLLELWGDQATGFDVVARACGTSNLDGVLAAFDALCAAAGLPSTLDGLGIPWEAVEATLPQAVKSSGMSFLPRPLAPGELESFAKRAWRSA